jgi:hypothetical protein
LLEGQSVLPLADLGVAVAAEEAVEDKAVAVKVEAELVELLELANLSKKEVSTLHGHKGQRPMSSSKP